MNWLPLPADFREQLRSAQASQTSIERLEKLAVLAQHKLSYIEIMQLDRALSGTVVEHPTFTATRVALLSSATVDHLIPGLRVAGLRRRLLLDIQIGQYGQYRQEVLDTSSSLHRFAPQTVVFSLTARDLLRDVPLTIDAAAADIAITQIIESLRNLWRNVRETMHASIVHQTFLNCVPTLFGSYERLVAGSPAQLIARLNDRLAEAASKDGVLLLDVARASEKDGLDAWYDEIRWLQGKMEISPQAAPMYGELCARVIAAQRGLSKKCLVLDLDNTLWGGVVGDDGIDGIVLGEGSPIGEAHLALQRYAKQLKDRGIILAVCSKNDPKIAEEAFDKHPEMHLKRSEVAAFVANWDPKPENLKLIAAKLNIGIDSLVFVDDNPVERAAIRQALPMVAVPELPTDIAQYVRCLADAGYFEAAAFTTEDRDRGEQYAANLSREAARESSQSLEDFLLGLQMSTVYGTFKPVDLIRIAQLINKTNQFNTTTRRYTLEEVTRIASEPLNITIQFRLIDRYGDNGLISAMILRGNSAQPDALEIDTWIMSCRVFGRQLEFEAMNIAVEAARERGVRRLYADFVPTAKNGVIKDLYATLGFEQMPSKGNDSGIVRWCLQLDEYSMRNTHISRRAE